MSPEYKLLTEFAPPCLVFTVHHYDLYNIHMHHGELTAYQRCKNNELASKSHLLMQLILLCLDQL